MNEYITFITDVFSECYRVLVDGGRICVNIANIGRSPYKPLHKHMIDILSDIGFLMRGEIIWDKGASVGGSCAWGSWKSASNPSLRDVHEYILVFSKGKYGREKGISTITRDEFLEYTKSIWSFKTESAKKIGHPAPFPVELPYRCIQLYSYEGDVILDPFSGSGTTAVACIKTNRGFICVDKEENYIDLAKDRVSKIQKKL